MLGVFKRKRNSDPLAELRGLVGPCELGTFPAAVMGVLQAIRDPDASLVSVGDKVMVDPGLVVKVLRTVNSAAFGLATRVDSVPHAVSLMGRSKLESLVLALAVRDVLPRPKVPGFDAKTFWRAAARRASLARALAVELHPASQAESFTSALLQDMAVPVIAAVKPEQYGPVLQAWHADSGTSLAALECEVLGWTHPDVGRLMGEAWNLPGRLVESIGGHHGGVGAEPAVQLVAHIRESDDDSGLEPLVEDARTRFGMKPDVVMETVTRAYGQAADLATLLQ